MGATPDAQLASVDGEIMPLSAATVPASDEGVLRGDGVFEALRIYDGRPFALEAHLERLARSAATARLPLDVEAVRADAHRLLARAAEQPGRDVLRIVLTRGGLRLLITEPLPLYAGRARLRSVTYAPTRVLDGVKSLSYGANMLASRLAREQGADEALLVTPHGRVLEAPTSSVFWVHAGELLTPPLSEHILASITRSAIISLCGAQERSCELDELLAADEIFLASSVREVQAVGELDGRRLPSSNPVTTRAAAALREHIRTETTAAGGHVSSRGEKG